MYRLSASKTEKYNTNYHHLVYELRNTFRTKTSFASHVYSLGYILKYLPIKIIYPILHIIVASNFNFENDG